MEVLKILVFVEKKNRNETGKRNLIINLIPAPSLEAIKRFIEDASFIISFSILIFFQVRLILCILGMEHQDKISQ